MMQVFRNIAKPIVAVTVVAFISWLVYDLSGLGTGGPTGSSMLVGTIDGREISYSEFEQRVSNVLDQQRQSGVDIGLDETEAIRNQVWDDLVKETLYRKEFSTRGITVSDAEIAEAIRMYPLNELQQEPSFQTDGKFDLEKYQRWLASAQGQMLVPALEAQYRTNILENKLARAVVSNVFISDGRLWQFYRDEKEQVKVGIVRINPAIRFTDEMVPATDAEAKKYYDEHQDQFKRPERAYLSYVFVSRAPNASDTATALARAKALRDEIVGGVAPFEEVAKRESADPVSAANGGDLGEKTKADFVAPFSDAAEALKVNEVSEPVLTQFGYHLIQVTSRTKDKFKSRHVLIPIELAGAHKEKVDALVDSLENLVAERLEAGAIDTAARALGLAVQKAGPVMKGGRIFTPEAGMVPNAATWAFRARPGQHSELFENSTGYFVFRLDSAQAEGLAPFEAAKPEALARVKAIKKAEDAKKVAEELVAATRSGKTLGEAAKAAGLDYQESGPFARLNASLPDPKLIGLAFSLAPGEIGGPMLAGYDETQPEVFLMVGLSRTPADSAEFAKNLTTIREQALQSARQLRWQVFNATLKDGAKIVDRRDELYKELSRRTAD